MNFKSFMQRSGPMIPFGMTFGTLMMLLIVGLNGVPGNFMGPIVTIKTQDLSISPSSLSQLTGINLTDAGTSNLTASSFDLADKYIFYLWGYATTEDGKTTFHKRSFNYMKNIDVSTVTIEGEDYATPHKLTDLKKSAQTKVMVSEGAFLAALSNAFFVVAAGVAGAMGRPVRLLIVIFFTGVTLLTVVILAAMVSALDFGTKSSLSSWKHYGVDVTMGTSDLGIVWLAAIHVLVVGVMWVLMAVGVMQMNPLLKKDVERKHDHEALAQLSTANLVE
ncbi:hypothetical protein ASPZODRAFT_130437 [Penicilliopsis zonata CBS 506.65]|uniref:Uncharacterized protein n=1 Tax=Penicilliopsis zonata CBS 506.65 TaxID=1073090 RepID=A0A1L9SMB0_9EURO|nr:hypothetical protein ASPZODRAFT_130437 [Penicilliopsis zonata CBS 506.65]OJJ48412.1 hypothetical protein ASPZODRAFT_130437 [Penicilliopsis zonata CBS 506.65]